MEFTGFGKGALTFFDELASNNNTQWWHENRPRYDSEIRAPLEFLLANLAAEFGEAKVFRPNRDTRFSPDKSPYKTQAAALVSEGEKQPGVLYVALSAGGLHAGGGCYMPASDQLSRMRAAIDDDAEGSELEAILTTLKKAKADIWSRDAVRTAPKGYKADHPRIDLLRMKGMTAMFDLGAGAWLYKAEARERVAKSWRALGPLNDWLDRNVGATDLPPRGR
jgi:uncharacterized protein (TIGR02453 family)